MRSKRKVNGYIYAGTSGDFAEDLFLKPKAKQKTILLEVIGDSMTGDGINPGDLVRIKFCTFALPGTICAVQTPYGPVLKRFEPRQNGQVVLRSSNKGYNPQLWAGAELRLIGILTAIFTK